MKQMFKKKNNNSEINYDNDFKVVVASNASDDQLKVHSPNSLRSLESFSRSSESLALPVTPLESKGQDKEKRKKKSRSATRIAVNAENKSSRINEMADDIVSRDHGESFMSEMLRNINKESQNNVVDSEAERLRLMNIKLNSKLSRLCQENENFLQSKLHIQSELEIAKQESADTKSLMEALEEDLESSKRNREMDQKKISELEVTLAMQQSDIQSKMIDFKQIGNDLKEYQDNLAHANEKIRSVTEELDSKNHVVVDLKKKISEFHSQLELTKLYQENCEYKAEQLEYELQTMKKARSWFEDQLKSAEETKDKLQIEIHRVKNCLMESDQDRDACRQKNKLLELKLAKIQEMKLQQTTELLFELEQLQKEFFISEDEKRALHDQYGEIMNRYNEKINELEAEKETNRQLKERIEELSTELEAVECQYNGAQKSINELEQEGSEVRKKLALLEEDFVRKSWDLEESERARTELEVNLNQLEMNFTEKETTILGLKEEMGNLKMSFDRVRTERDQACVGIDKLREEIGQVENQFEITRQNLADKEQVLKLVEDLHDELKGKLAKEIEEGIVKEKSISLLKTEKRQLLESCEQFQQNNVQILAELDSLRNNLNLANISIAGLEEQLTEAQQTNNKLIRSISDSQSEVEQFRADFARAQKTIESLTSVQEMYGKLFEDHARLEEGYCQLVGEHKKLSEEYQHVTGDLKAKLSERTDELERLVTMKDEMVSATQNDLQLADQNNRELKNELENLKFSHTVELATKEEQFREQLDKSCREFSDMCQEKIRCETAIVNLVDEYNKQLADCKTKMVLLQEQSTAYAEFENTNRVLMEDLERKKGEIEAILYIWEKMKDHARGLENALTRQDAHIHHLINTHEEALWKKDDEIQSLKAALNVQYNRFTTEESIKNNFLCQLEERVSVIDQLRKKVDNFERTCEEMQTSFSGLSCEYEAVCKENQFLKESQHQLTLELQNKIKENSNLANTNQKLLENIDQALLSAKAQKKTSDSLEKEYKHQCVQAKHTNKKNEDLMKDSKQTLEKMTKILQDVKSRNDSLTRRIELSNQQDIVMTTILKQLRSEIQRIIFHKNDDMVNSINLTSDDLKQLQKLLKESQDPVSNLRPQTRLTKCIDDLRMQIDSIQCEISEQIEQIGSAWLSDNFLENHQSPNS